MVQIELVMAKHGLNLQAHLKAGRALQCAALVVFGLSCPLVAQERISPEAFLDIADGKTLDFTELQSGALVGIEEYLSRKLSVWKDQSGLCVYGRITVEAGQLCFLYDNDADGLPVCWWTFRDGDTLMVLLADFERHEIQTVTRISDDTLDCPSIPAA